jgi:hypothetical protein
MPYLRVGAGMTSYQAFERVTTPAFTGGVGVLIPLGDYLFVAPESRLLIEVALRVTDGLVLTVRQIAREEHAGSFRVAVVDQRGDLGLSSASQKATSNVECVTATG